MISKCPSCQAAINVPPEAVGKKVRCSGCQSVFVIEAEAAPPAPKQEPAAPKKAPDAKAGITKKPAAPKPAPAPAPQQAENPLAFGDGGAAGPAADFSFGEPGQMLPSGRGGEMRVKGAGTFLLFATGYAFLPFAFNAAMGSIFSLVLPTVGGLMCCSATTFIIGAPFMLTAGVQMRRMRWPGVGLTGGIFSLLLGLTALGPVLGVSGMLCLAGALASDRPGASGPNFGSILPWLTIGTGVLAFFEFVFSSWAGLRVIMTLRSAMIRNQMRETVNKKA